MNVSEIDSFKFLIIWKSKINICFINGAVIGLNAKGCHPVCKVMLLLLLFSKQMFAMSLPAISAAFFRNQAHSDENFKKPQGIAKKGTGYFEEPSFIYC